MRIYTVHIKSHIDAAGDDAVVVREGFNWAAFVFTVLWALSRRLWLTAFLIFVAIAALNVALTAVDADGLVMTAAQIGLSLVIGFGANDWRRGGLAHRGYEEFGPIAAPDPDAALLYYAEQARPSRPAATETGAAPTAGAAA